MEQFGNWIGSNWWVIVLFVVVVILLVLLAIFLGTIGRIGLIRGTLQAETGTGALALGELFSGSTPFFWRVFGLTFLIGLIFLFTFLPLILFGVVTAGIGFICLAPLFCVLAILGMLVNLVIELANVAIVKENLSLAEGWRRGWSVARLNLGPVVIMALILFVISFVIGLVIAIPVIVIVLPAALGVALNNGQNMTPLLIGGLCFVAYLPVAILVSGVLNTYMGAAWTLTYLRLAAPPADNTPVVVEANA